MRNIKMNLEKNTRDRERKTQLVLEEVYKKSVLSQIDV